LLDGLPYSWHDTSARHVSNVTVTYHIHNFNILLICRACSKLELASTVRLIAASNRTYRFSGVNGIEIVFALLHAEMESDGSEMMCHYDCGTLGPNSSQCHQKRINYVTKLLTDESRIDICSVQTVKVSTVNKVNGHKKAQLTQRQARHSHRHLGHNSLNHPSLAK